MPITKCPSCPVIKETSARAVVLYTGQLYLKLFLSIFMEGISSITGSGEYSSPKIRRNNISIMSYYNNKLYKDCINNIYFDYRI